MQLQFRKQEVPCLRSLLTRVQTLEQTQEVTVAEDRDGAEILGVWGQPVLRTKERQGDRLLITGGIPARVLLGGAEGASPSSLEAWIPFRMDWDLPGEMGEGIDRVLPLLSGLDARWTGAGKLLIRAGISALAECWQETVVSVPQPSDVPEDVAVHRHSWPVWLPKEAGEKLFSLEETLTLPSSQPAVEKILYDCLTPVITDQKVLGNKIVFRGSANLHLCWLCPEGKVHSFDTELPFSQYAQLQGNFSPDARVQVLCAVTRLELDRTGAGELTLRSDITGQYLVEDRQLLETVDDAYSPHRSVEIEHQELPLPMILEERRESLRTEEKLSLTPDGVVDVTALTDLPRMGRQGDRITLEVLQRCRALHYDEAGILRGTEHRWNQAMELEAEEHSHIMALPGQVRIRLTPGVEGASLETELPMTLRTLSGTALAVVSSLTLGETVLPDPGRPSLILRRAGTDTLWDLARRSGSTVEAICRANGLEGEPEPERMLLIPVL